MCDMPAYFFSERLLIVQKQIGRELMNELSNPCYFI